MNSIFFFIFDKSKLGIPPPQLYMFLLKPYLDHFFVGGFVRPCLERGSGIFGHLTRALCSIFHDRLLNEKLVNDHTSPRFFFPRIICSLNFLFLQSYTRNFLCSYFCETKLVTITFSEQFIGIVLTFYDTKLITITFYRSFFKTIYRNYFHRQT